jgi:hypothetical protein
MRKNSRRRVLLVGILFVAAVLAVGCTGSSSSFATAAIGSSEIGSSQWQGEIRGQVYGQSFHLPLDVVFREPLPDENNPVNVFLGAGDPSQVGNVFLTSASQYTVSSGQVTLQYFSVETSGSELSAILTDAHFSEAAAANLFTAPNVSAQSAPEGPGRQIYETMGPTEMFAFLEETQLNVNVSGDTLSGNVQGSGQSITGVFPTGDVVYSAEFTAARVE